ncbi:Sodium- and chloride-dependent glycine transporter 1 [Lamellibrachia satsuma]|nr:Sodium- and chloride-dependent glycine transporter 1 [Lamellibrachia satsuma]
MWIILKDMGVPIHLVVLLRNLYANQKATVRTEFGETEQFDIGKESEWNGEELPRLSPGVGHDSPAQGDKTHGAATMGPFQSFKASLATRCCKKQQKGADVEDPPKKKEENIVGRAQWSSPTEFTLTCIGYSVGLGNVWRFPYLCYKNGGGAFLIPYMIMIGLIGMPLLFMEYSLGQYFGIGSLSIFKKVCPLFQGVGIGYIVLNALVCIYYNVIIALSLYYLFGSFQAVLPWSTCDNEWNTEHCGDPSIQPVTVSTAGNASIVMTTVMNHTAGGPSYAANAAGINHTEKVSPSDEYFRLALMNMNDSHSIENLGNIRWHLCLCLLLAWILVVMFVSRGIKSTGKVAYFTATFPYVMLTVLVVRGVTLPGASEGILYFVTPDWTKLLNPEIWFAAASQLFYSTNLAWGGMITMASYSNFNHNCFRDAIMINIVSFLTSLYAGFAVFSIIGYMAVSQGVEIKDVIDSGPGLAFIVYPRALSLMPLAPMWTALFFFMLFLLGIGSQVNAPLTTLIMAASYGL